MSRVCICMTVLLVAGLALSAPAQTPLGTAFTYQGQLNKNGSAVTSTADFQFTLFDDAVIGNQIGATIPLNAVSVSKGLFTVPLDFGATAFDGNARWLQIAVRSPAGSGSFTTLNPRQPLTAAPYALQTRGLYVDASENVGIGTTSPATRLHIKNILGGQNDAAALFEMHNCGEVCGQESYSEAIRLLNDNPNGQVGLGFLVDSSSTMQTVPDVWLGTAYNGFGMANDFLVATRTDPNTLTNRLFIDGNSGSVGVGTTSPAATLDVIGNTALPHLRIAAKDDSTTPYGSFLSLDATPTTGGKDWIIYSTGASAGEGLGELVFRNLTDGTPPIAFDANGQVGIGTTTPGDRLSILGGALSFANPSNPIPYVGMDYDQTSDALRVRTNLGGAGLNTTAVTVQRGGNVGIGTTTPGALLDLSSGFQSSERLRLSGQEFYQSNNSSSDGVSFLLGVNRNTNRQLWIADSARLAPTSNNPTIRISPGGGIDALATDGVTSLNLTMQQGSGNLGIGSGSPTNKLSVFGNANVSGNVEVGASTVSNRAGWSRTLEITGSSDAGVTYATTGSQTVWSQGKTSDDNFTLFETAPNNTTSARVVVAPGGDVLVAGGISCKTVGGFNSNSWSVYGASSNYDGIGGFANGTNHDGVYGESLATSGTGAGVVGVENAPSGWGLYAIGDSGASGVKLFHIDHPQDPTHKYLNHFSSEGPEPYNVYSGSVVTDGSGVGWVELPGYFETLNRDYRYQLTVADESDDSFVQAKVWRKIENNRFAIRTSAPNVEVFWQITGVRNDPAARRGIAAKAVEQAKVGDAIGKYLEPELYGQPRELSERPRQIAPAETRAQIETQEPVMQFEPAASPTDEAVSDESSQHE